MANDLTDGKEFLGAGIAFPLRLDSAGHIQMNEVDEHVRQSILLILRTAKGERVMRPEFGTNIYPLIFSPITAATAALVQHEVKDALVRFEPRIDILKVEATSDSNQQGVLLVEIEYRVRTTDTIFNLVYPFYLERGII